MTFDSFDLRFIVLIVNMSVLSRVKKKRAKVLPGPGVMLDRCSVEVMLLLYFVDDVVQQVHGFPYLPACGFSWSLHTPGTLPPLNC